MEKELIIVNVWNNSIGVEYNTGHRIVFKDEHDKIVLKRALQHVADVIEVLE